MRTLTPRADTAELLRCYRRLWWRLNRGCWLGPRLLAQIAERNAVLRAKFPSPPKEDPSRDPSPKLDV